MKNLKHLFLSSYEHIGTNLTLLNRFRAASEEDAVMTMGLSPDNQKKCECSYLMVTLRRIGEKGDKSFDDVYVMGHVLPATVEDIMMGDGITPCKSLEGYCDVSVVPKHCGNKLRVLRLRRNFLGKFVSIQNNGHATKGGVYGSAMFNCEYTGVFKSMPEMYQALKSIYQDL